MSVINDQYIFEVQSWFRTLDYLQQENIHMKNRIAEVIKKARIQRNGLDTLEMYLNTLLDKDTLISFTRQDIRKIENDPCPSEDLRHYQEIVRVDIEKMEKEFCHLRAEFNRYISTVNLTDEIS